MRLLAPSPGERMDPTPPLSHSVRADAYRQQTAAHSASRVMRRMIFHADDALSRAANIIPPPDTPQPPAGAR